MNRALVLVLIPGLIINFVFMTIAWGPRISVPVVLGEASLLAAILVYFRRREQAHPRQSAADTSKRGTP